MPEAGLLISSIRQLTLTLRRGGRLRLALSADESSTDSAVLNALRSDSPTRSNDTHRALELGYGATARLFCEDGTVIPLRFYAPHLLINDGYAGILPGTQCLTQSIVPSGRHRLRVQHGDFVVDEVEVEVEVDVGEITAVVVSLPRFVEHSSRD